MTETATKRYDPLSSRTWLEFAGKPAPEVIASLKAKGWRWGAYRQQWHTNARYPRMPEGVTIEDAGLCDYSAERADRLAESAEKHLAKASDYQHRSDRLVEPIPFGQPILIGHHSEKRHRRTLERAQNLMFKAVDEWKTAERQEQRAKDSARHQRRRNNPRLIYNRVQQHRADLAHLERHQSHYSAEDYATRRATIEQRLQIEESALADAGGYTPPTTQSTGVQPGDLFSADGYTWRAVRVNRKTITATARVSGSPWTRQMEPERVWEIVEPCPEGQKPCRFCKAAGTHFVRDPQSRYGAGTWEPCELCNGSGLTDR